LSYFLVKLFFKNPMPFDNKKVRSQLPGFFALCPAPYALRLFLIIFRPAPYALRRFLISLSAL
jgi:hypothetical protein